MSRIRKSREIESRQAVARSWGLRVGRNVEGRQSVWELLGITKIDCGDGCTTQNVLKPLQCIHKNLSTQ